MDNGSIDKIYNDQRTFFDKGFTRSVSFRKNQLEKLLEMIITHQKEIFLAIKTDLNKSDNESFLTEVSIVILELKRAINNLKSWCAPKRVKDSFFTFPSKNYILPEPYGLTLIIAPWNYPFQLIFLPLIGAIAAGNCVILKPSPESAYTSILINKLISTTFSNEYIAVIEGGHDINQYILNKKFDYIFFTGSSSFGTYVATKAASTLTPVTLELGGKSPCIVDKSADLDLAAKRIIWGKLLNCGQTCIAPDYVFVSKEIKDDLINKFISQIKIFYGDNISENPIYPKIINEASFYRIQNLLKGSGKIVFGGESDIEKRYISPTIIDEPMFEDEIMKEEIFGPLLPVISYQNLNEVINYINSKDKPLALYFFGDKENACTVINNTSSGSVCINDTIIQITNPNLPFGGVGKSGMGSYHAKRTFDTFSHNKSVMIKSKKFDVSFRYPPFNLPNIIGNLFK